MKSSAIVTLCQHKMLYTLGLKNIYLKHYNQFKTRILVTKFDFLPLLFLGLHQLPNGGSRHKPWLGYLTTIEMVKSGKLTSAFQPQVKTSRKRPVLVLT